MQGRIMTTLAMALAGLLLVSGHVRADAPLAQREWMIDGVERKALIYAPPAATTDKSPLVFAFHGHGGTMRNASRSFAFHVYWPDALVVYMQGLPTPGAITDPEGKLPGWQRTRGDQGDRDLKFFDEVLRTLKKQCKVDSTRIFATGHSNGGAFTYLLWVARGDDLAAVAPSAAVSRDFRALKPKPALHIAAENDELVRFAMQKRMMDYVKQLNGCETDGKPWAKSGSLTGTLYSSKEGTPFISLIGPGTHKYPPEAPELIVRFFKECAAGEVRPAK